MQKLLKNKKGTLGINMVTGVMMALLVCVVMFIAVALALVSLNNAGIFTSGSTIANQTNDIVLNTTYAGTLFFKQIPTIFTILAIVVIISAIAIIILVVRRFGGTSQTGL